MTNKELYLQEAQYVRDALVEVKPELAGELDPFIAQLFGNVNLIAFTLTLVSRLIVEDNTFLPKLLMQAQMMAVRRRHSPEVTELP